MPAPLSVDLRERVVEAYEGGEGSAPSVARRFWVSPASVYRWRKRRRETGSVAPKTYRPGPSPRIDEACAEVLRALVDEQPDAYCWELAERLEQRTGVRVDADTVGRALRRLGLTRKKKR
jgi:transposase